MNLTAYAENPVHGRGILRPVHRTSRPALMKSPSTSSIFRSNTVNNPSCLNLESLQSPGFPAADGLAFSKRSSQLQPIDRFERVFATEVTAFNRKNVTSYKFEEPLLKSGTGNFARRTAPGRQSEGHSVSRRAFQCQDFLADSLRLHLGEPIKFKSSPVHNPILHFVPESSKVKSYVLGELIRRDRVGRVQNEGLFSVP